MQLQIVSLFSYELGIFPKINILFEPFVQKCFTFCSIPYIISKKASQILFIKVFYGNMY